jgi:hypothetical protein
MTSSGRSAHGRGTSDPAGITTNVCTLTTSYLGSTWKPPSVPIASLVTSVVSPSAGAIGTCAVVHAVVQRVRVRVDGVGVTRRRTRGTLRVARLSRSDGGLQSR